VNGRFFTDEPIKRGAVLEMVGVWARVCNEHIILNVRQRNSIAVSSMTIEKVNTKKNISLKAWIEK
jgi:hypothetical protein